jgi:hypothetical protein
MEKVYYKGQPYEFSVRKNNSHRVFTLYKDNTVINEVVEHDLDIKSVVSLILEDYYHELTRQEMKVVC